MEFDENDFFRQATLRICGSLHFENAVQKCFDYLRRYLPIDGICLGLYEPDNNVIRINAWIGPAHLKRPEPRVKLPEVYWKQFRKEWNKPDRIRIINDLNVEEPFITETGRMLWSEGNAMMHVDLKMEHKRVGGLTLLRVRRLRFGLFFPSIPLRSKLRHLFARLRR